MTSRILPPAEWPRLNGTEAETLWPTLDAAHAQILVVEDGEQILGCWTLMMIPHVECLWIDPNERARVTVARRLWLGMRSLASQMGARHVWTAAVSDPVRGLLDHAQARKLVGDHYLLPMERTH